MYVDHVDRLRMEQQIRNLNCGRFCLEAQMLWRHGSKYGRHPNHKGRQFPVVVNGRTVQHMDYGVKRHFHCAEAQEHIDDPRALGFDVDNYVLQYGLKKLARDPDTAQDWADELSAYGPLIVGGCIGAVEVLPRGGGHNVLVIGIDEQTDEIIYLDPLGKAVGGGLAFFGVCKRNANEEMRMARPSFIMKIHPGSVHGSCPQLPRGSQTPNSTATPWSSATTPNRAPAFAPMGGTNRAPASTPWVPGVFPKHT